jgi:hypothetical protein
MKDFIPFYYLQLIPTQTQFLLLFETRFELSQVIFHAISFIFKRKNASGNSNIYDSLKRNFKQYLSVLIACKYDAGLIFAPILQATPNIFAR